MPQVSAALKDVYISEIRNAVFHADYTLSDAEFHMIKDYYHSPKGYLTRDVPLPVLLALVDRSFAFYYAILNRHVLVWCPRNSWTIRIQQISVHRRSSAFIGG